MNEDPNFYLTVAILTLRQQLEGAQAEIEAYRQREAACWEALEVKPGDEALPSVISRLVENYKHIYDFHEH